MRATTVFQFRTYMSQFAIITISDAGNAIKMNYHSEVNYYIDPPVKPRVVNKTFKVNDFKSAVVKAEQYIKSLDVIGDWIQKDEEYIENCEGDSMRISKVEQTVSFSTVSS